MRVMLAGFLLLIVTVITWRLLFPPLRVPEWATYHVDHPMVKATEPTGRDLRWTAAREVGSTRLFLSDNPEYLTPLHPGVHGEGRLWVDEAAGDALTYRVFISHSNAFRKPIYIGLVIENLSPSNTVAVEGRWIATRVEPSSSLQGENNEKLLGKRNAYAELSGKLPESVSVTRVDQKGSARLLLKWRVKPGQILGARAVLTIRRVAGSGPVRCRLATAWAWQAGTLVRPLPLLSPGAVNPRGSWSSSEAIIDNTGDPFDVGKPDNDHSPVRWLRLCQPGYAGDGSKRYGLDVLYTQAKSFCARQAKTNNGLYGAHTQLRLHVVNSGNKAQRVEVYLRYAVPKLRGCFVGAATVYDLVPETGAWQAHETRALDMSNYTFRRSDDRRPLTRCLGSYPVPSGGRLEIPLTLTSDFPAMLPLAVVLRCR